MKRVPLLAVLALGLAADVSAQTAEEAAVRSSHPRGIASDGRPAQPMSANTTALPTNAAARHGSVSDAAPANAAPSGMQSGQGSVNISGATRIDARSHDAKAAAIGQKNTAGNRVGTIGGKQD
jgi:hypothetical protein